jgi:hypothetical protein
MTTDSNIWRRSCAGACHQGRHPCSTPQACEVPDDAEYDTPQPGVIVWLLAAVLVGATAAFVVLVTR